MSLNIKTNTKKRNLKTKDELKQSNNDLALAFIAAKAAEEKKGENIVLLDVSRLTVIADYFLVISAKSPAQIEAIAKNIEESMSKLKYNLIFKEGFPGSNWTVLDFGNLVVHIMNEKERNYYKLERFWSNAVVIDNKVWEKAS